MSAIIEVNNVTKAFPARRGPRDLRGRGGLGDWLLGRKEKTFTALHDITLAVSSGESLGIIGRNGSGKSTLLSIIAGVTLPTHGHVVVRGRIASLLELGAGFNPVLTGRENIYLNAGLLGMRHAQVDEVFDDIVRFSGIEKFIDQPVETYSSGMYVRIGFSVAAHVNPDVFLADEVLAVGDAEFQRKCRSKIGEFREQGKTIVFVSHDLGIVNTLCERVVLLDNGRMIQRETAHKTITYYLRQVGMEKGIHKFSNGDLEAIHCDGRISLFHAQEEVSAPSGFDMQFLSLNERHSSTDASWETMRREPDGCAVEGRMLRLPVKLLWNLHIENNRFIWRIALSCERDTPLNEILVNIHLPTGYDRWVHSDLAGTFPDITPSDVTWTMLVAPEDKAEEAAALPKTGTALPPIIFYMKRHNQQFGFFWANTEYVLYSRVLSAMARFPEHSNCFKAGRHELLEVALDLNVAEDKVMEHICADRVIQCGKLTARFEQGRIRLRWNDLEITTNQHVYASMLINHLWNDSQSLQWHGITAIQDGIQVVGESRRFPYALEWHITRCESGLHLRIFLDAASDIEAQECHVAIVAPDAFTHWATDYEQNQFPDHVADRNRWTHCNSNYAPGRSIMASGPGYPSIKMLADDTCPPVRMTAINTSYEAHARVLQALRPSDPEPLRFPKGRHLYFSGTIVVDDTRIKN